jgi:tRNA pseudouridine38-40 synthase
MTKLREILQKYLGTKNYHNYTKKGNPNAKTNHRYMLELECEEFDTSYLYADNPESDPGIPIMKITLVGQSFIYNQIRKMVGMWINIISEGLDDFVIDNSFCANKMPIWLAPGEGLLLDRLYFDGYNKKKDIPELLVLKQGSEEEIE